MFAIVHMSDVVRIPPNRLTHSLNDGAMQILKEKYESMISPGGWVCHYDNGC